MADASPAAPPVRLAIVAHPDDETIGLSTRLAEWGATAHVLTITDGAPRDRRAYERHGFARREDYAAARAAEQLAALAIAGVAAEHCQRLEIVDQDAALHLPEIARRIAARVDSLSPEMVFTHSYEGGHPDHDATACAVRLALDLLARDGGSRPLLEFPAYRADLDDAPPAALADPPRPASQRRASVAFRFLPGGPPETTVVLSSRERERKRRMYACYRTQSLEGFFTPDVERYRLAPRYDFTRPPHPGLLHYEKHAYEIRGDRFRALCAQARAALLGAAQGAGSARI
ncbi:MAG: PIG-L family deacetylase [Deltaproteobacteria bacterium]|nr:MAG: PIG-L family deacetylase [Deltaproteobacteria bacterium]TMQ12432.1 MAG: PIG-L family deacetylase [Deltaproteobacteria bacterium]